MASLRIIEGPGTGTELSLGEIATLGRSRDCDIQIKDRESSRVHARVSRADGQYKITDLASSNGTFVNDTVIDERVLVHGDLVRIGTVTLVYEDAAPLKGETVLLEPVVPGADDEAEPKPLEPEAMANLIEKADAAAEEPVLEAPVAEGPGEAAFAELEKEADAAAEEPVLEALAPEGPSEDAFAELEKEARAANEETDAHAALAEEEDRGGTAKMPPEKPEELEGPPGFEIIKPLNRDDLATTYLANDLAMDREAAVEMLDRTLCSDPEGALDRIKRAARLQHPALAAIYCAGIGRDGVFVCRERAQGQPLWDLCGKLPPAEVAAIGAALAGALAEAHESSLVHGSLRPDRVVRLAGGQVKLLGLGLPAPDVTELSDKPDLQKRANRIAYMPPDQLKGVRPTTSCDVYSLGATLYHALCGRVPFPGTCESAMASRIPCEAVTPVLELRPEAPKPLARLIERMLSRYPAERPRSMAEAKQAFEETVRKAVPAGPQPVRAAAAEPQGLSASTIIIIIITLLLLGAMFIIGKIGGESFIRKALESTPATSDAREGRWTQTGTDEHGRTRTDTDEDGRTPAPGSSFKFQV